jgi:hypothetical protein
VKDGYIIIWKSPWDISNLSPLIVKRKNILRERIYIIEKLGIESLKCIIHKQLFLMKMKENGEERRTLLIGLMRISWYSNNKSTVSIKN